MLISMILQTKKGCKSILSVEWMNTRAKRNKMEKEAEKGNNNNFSISSDLPHHNDKRYCFMRIYQKRKAFLDIKEPENVTARQEKVFFFLFDIIYCMIVAVVWAEYQCLISKEKRKRWEGWTLVQLSLVEKDAFSSSVIIRCSHWSSFRLM